MTFDEYRTQIIHSITARPDIAWARDVLAQTQAVFVNCGVSAQSQARFWDNLLEELELVEEQDGRLNEHAACTLRAVIAAAQAAIAQYQRLILSGQQEPS